MCVHCVHVWECSWQVCVCVRVQMRVCVDLWITSLSIAGDHIHGALSTFLPSMTTGRAATASKTANSRSARRLSSANQPLMMCTFIFSSSFPVTSFIKSVCTKRASPLIWCCTFSSSKNRCLPVLAEGRKVLWAFTVSPQPPAPPRPVLPLSPQTGCPYLLSYARPAAPLLSEEGGFRALLESVMPLLNSDSAQGCSRAHRAVGHTRAEGGDSALGATHWGRRILSLMGGGGGGGQEETALWVSHFCAHSFVKNNYFLMSDYLFSEEMYFTKLSVFHTWCHWLLPCPCTFSHIGKSEDRSASSKIIISSRTPITVPTITPASAGGCRGRNMYYLPTYFFFILWLNKYIHNT